MRAVAVTGWLGLVTGGEDAEQSMPGQLLHLPAGLCERGVPIAGAARRASDRAENTIAGSTSPFVSRGETVRFQSHGGVIACLKSQGSAEAVVGPGSLPKPPLLPSHWRFHVGGNSARLARFGWLHSVKPV